MSTGLKANSDGSAAIQVGGTDYITISSAGATTFLASPTIAQAGTASAPSITFAGDTNTGIYSPGADRIGFTENGTQVGEFDASGNFKFNSGYGSVATAYGCRAWVNFNGANAFSPNPSTSAIRASGNVTSITKNATGDYTVNLTNALPDENYAVVCLNTQVAGNAPVNTSINTSRTSSASVVQIATMQASVRLDSSLVHIAVFR